MKKLKFYLAAFFAVGMPITFGASALAATDSVPVVCPTTVLTNLEAITVNNNVGSCDLSIDKLVSVNGGAFVEADTSADAANAHVGDTIVWRVIVTNNSGELTPHGVVYVKDILPSGLSFVNYGATSGTYTPDDGSFSANTWFLPLLKSDGADGFVTTLPATLDITTTATGTGLIQNTASFSKYDPGFCDGGCVYSDADADNNSNDAWVNVQTKPQVLGTSTTRDPQVLASSIVNTGNGAKTNIMVGSFILSGLALVWFARPKKPAKYKI